MRRLALLTALLLSALWCHGQANCFAHTTLLNGPPTVSAPMNDTGATMLIAFATVYAANVLVKDVTGGPNTWYQLGFWNIGNGLTGSMTVSVAINPITNTAATFKAAGGAASSQAQVQIWACNGVNTTDLFYTASGLQSPGNGPDSLGAAIGPTDTTITIRAGTQVGPIYPGDYGTMAAGSIREYFQVISTSGPQTGITMVVQRGVLGSTASSWGVNQAMFIGTQVAIPSCSPPSALSPSAVGDLEFVAAGRAGTGAPGAGTTATINWAGFSPPLVVGGTVMAWRAAPDLSSFQPTLTMSQSDQWACVGIVLKGSASPSAVEPHPLIHNVVGNGYQCNSPAPSNPDCPAPAPGNGGPPLQATLNWPTEVLWYKHGVPPNKVMVFIDNQANLLRAVNFDTVPHTVANVVIQPNTIAILAGTGIQGGGDGSCIGNNGPALSAQMMHPAGVAEDPTTGNIAVADQQCASIDIIDTSGNFHWAAGGGSGGTTFPGCGVQTRHGNRVNVPATQALLTCPQSSDFDANGNLIFGDDNWRIYIVNMQSVPINAYGVTGIQPGYIVAIAGVGVEGCTASATPKVALSTYIWPLGMFVDRATGDVYFGSAYCFQAAKLTADGHVVLLAGQDWNPTGGGVPSQAQFGYSPDGTPAIGARTGYIFKVTLDAGVVHFTDTQNNLIRHIDASGNLVTDAGNYQRWGLSGGWYGDNGGATRAHLNYPTGHVYDSNGNLCIANLISNVIPCTYGGAAPSLTGGGFVAAKVKWVANTFITGATLTTNQPIYGGPGQPGATTATLSGNTVVINDSANSVLPQIQTTAEVAGQSWSFTVTNQAIYLILFNQSHTFIDKNSGLSFAFNPPTPVSIGSATMYMYQSANPLHGSYRPCITPCP